MSFDNNKQNMARLFYERIFFSKIFHLYISQYKRLLIIFFSCNHHIFLYIFIYSFILFYFDIFFLIAWFQF